MFKYTTEFDYIRKKVLRKVAGSHNATYTCICTLDFLLRWVLWMQPSETLIFSKLELTPHEVKVFFQRLLFLGQRIM